MDTSDEYIKMIRSLPDEFFADWEFNDGDKVYLTEEIDDYSPSDVHGLYTVFDGLLAHDGIHETENWLYVRVVDFKNGRPIPSQEQLQNKIKVYNKSIDIDMYDYCLITQIGTWCYRQPVESVKNESIECLTLMFYQWLNGERWDGETWVKI
jgi:hypothetical protein